MSRPRILHMRKCLIYVLLLVGLAAAHGAGATEQPTSEPERVPVIGYLSWPGHDLSRGNIRVFSDARHTRLVAAVNTQSASGNFILLLPPGAYWLVAVVDTNGNGKWDAGDGMGFYGVTDVTRRQGPPPLVIDHGMLSPTVMISISVQAQADGRLKAIAVRPPSPLPEAGRATVTGRCETLLDGDLPVFVLFDAVFPRAVSAAAKCDKDGAFSVELPPAGYHLLAVQDLNGSGRIDAGDIVGIAEYSAALGPNMPVLHLEVNESVDGLTVPLEWGIDTRGLLVKDQGRTRGPRIQIGSLPAIVSGTVRAAGEPAPGAIVIFFGDPQLSEKIVQVKCDDKGRYCAALHAANYYVGAFGDANGDGQIGPADKAGFYGLQKADQEGPPPPLSLEPGQIAQGVDISLLMQLPQRRETSQQDTNTEPVDTNAVEGR